MRHKSRLRRLERRAATPAARAARAAAAVGALSEAEIDALAGDMTEAEHVQICAEVRQRERAGLPLCPP